VASPAVHQKNSFEAASFILIVQHHVEEQRASLFAGMALRHFARKVLQETIRENDRAHARSRHFLVPAPEVRTRVNLRVLLRISVKSGPAGAGAHHTVARLRGHGFWTSLDPRPQ